MTPEEWAHETYQKCLADETDESARAEISYGREVVEQYIANAIRAAVVDEREACAKVADEFDDGCDQSYPAGAIVEAIRARGK